MPGTLQVTQQTQPELANTVRRVVSHIQFKPARVGGRPVAAWVTLPVTLPQPAETDSTERSP